MIDTAVTMTASSMCNREVQKWGENLSDGAAAFLDRQRPGQKEIDAAREIVILQIFGCRLGCRQTELPCARRRPPSLGHDRSHQKKSLGI
jgi:hypothetical protein